MKTNREDAFLKQIYLKHATTTRSIDGILDFRYQIHIINYCRTNTDMNEGIIPTTKSDKCGHSFSSLLSIVDSMSVKFDSTRKWLRTSEGS